MKDQIVLIKGNFHFLVFEIVQDKNLLSFIGNLGFCKNYF